MQCLHCIGLFLYNLESEENFTMRIIANNIIASTHKMATVLITRELGTREQSCC